MSKWWIAIAVGRRHFALWGDGRRESWPTSDVNKGRCYGLLIGRVDEPVMDQGETA